MLQRVTIITRASFGPPLTPATGNLPRLFGANEMWLKSKLQPFYNLPCDAQSSEISHGGWPEGTGVVRASPITFIILFEWLFIITIIELSSIFIFIYFGGCYLSALKVSFKSVFERVSLGYAACEGNAPLTTIDGVYT
jgi:hypothetical protein